MPEGESSHRAKMYVITCLVLVDDDSLSCWTPSQSSIPAGKGICLIDAIQLPQVQVDVLTTGVMVVCVGGSGQGRNTYFCDEGCRGRCCLLLGGQWRNGNCGTERQGGWVVLGG